MQSLLGIASKLPSRLLLTRFARPPLSPFVPRFATTLDARRTLHTSFILGFPARATQTKSKKSATKARTTVKAKKPKAKATRTTRRKPKPKPKRVAAKKPAKPKKKVEKKPKIKVTKAMQPPTGYPGPYVLYFQKYLADHPIAGGKEALAQLARECGAEWRTLTAVEKQAYREESAALREVYHKKREDYFRNLNPQVFQALNKRRVQKGMKKFRIPSIPGVVKRPQTAYFRFLAEFRKSDEAAGLEAKETTLKAAEKWRALPESEKADYHEAWKKEKAEYTARHA